MAGAEGTVVAAFGRHYEVQFADGRCVRAFPRGKKSEIAVGDVVALDADGGDGAQILEHRPRTSLLYRSDAYRQKLIAANVSQIVLVGAAEPAIHDLLLSRAIVAAEAESIGVVIVLNKIDLADKVEAARAILAPFAALGYRIVEICAKRDVTALDSLLHNEASVLVGQSGMGKSSIINALLPGTGAATREISAALDSGKHTTTHARMYGLPAGGKLIDCPGLQEFGLAHLGFGQIEQGFIEFRPYLGHCRFRDCRHGSEPDCAVREAVQAGRIDARRYRHFSVLVGESAKHNRF